MTNDPDKIWFIRLQQGDHQGLRYLFDQYYTPLCRYVNTLIMDETEAEDIVQTIYIYVWEHREDITLTGSVRSYLFAACHHKALNYLRDKRKFTPFMPEHHDIIYVEMDVETNDLHRLIEEAVLRLPEKCGKIFRMSRVEDLSYKEIADREGITVKTVEAQIHTALKRLRKYLANLMVFF